MKKVFVANVMSSGLIPLLHINATVGKSSTKGLTMLEIMHKQCMKLEYCILGRMASVAQEVLTPNKTDASKC